MTRLFGRQLCCAVGLPFLITTSRVAATTTIAAPPPLPPPPPPPPPPPATKNILLYQYHEFDESCPQEPQLLHSTIHPQPQTNTHRICSIAA
ncbi:hypothetical protein BC937DRAFT_91077 [Endogone sp. FLAS-F59071]|nr:hypothetical protein BC937DRAFT_91077 [Endogone sp. FLAS-F59071]|eukprot:RUS16557.1 hypothetical protein BC937DRAFT_91077 [Endogone sp. FLAS-F59071]